MWTYAGGVCKSQLPSERGREAGGGGVGCRTDRLGLKVSALGQNADGRPAAGLQDTGKERALMLNSRRWLGGTANS